MKDKKQERWQYGATDLDYSSKKGISPRFEQIQIDPKTAVKNKLGESYSHLPFDISNSKVVDL